MGFLEKIQLLKKKNREEIRYVLPMIKVVAGEEVPAEDYVITKIVSGPEFPDYQSLADEFLDYYSKMTSTALETLISNEKEFLALDSHPLEKSEVEFIPDWHWSVVTFTVKFA